MRVLRKKVNIIIIVLILACTFNATLVYPYPTLVSTDEYIVAQKFYLRPPLKTSKHAILYNIAAELRDSGHLHDDRFDRDIERLNINIDQRSNGEIWVFQYDFGFIVKDNDISTLSPRPPPNMVEIEITNFCNLQCSVCRRGNPDYPKEHIVHMSLADFKEIIDHYDYPIKIFQFCGTAESTANPYLIDMVEYVASKKNPDQVELITNGTLLSPRLSRALIEAGVTVLKVSIDGPDEESYQLIRHHNLEPVANNIQEFRRIAEELGKQVTIQVNAVITQSNIDRIKDMPQFVRTIGGDRLELRIFETNLENLEHLSVYDKERLSSLRDAIEEQSMQWGIECDFWDFEETSQEACNLKTEANINYRGYLTICYHLPEKCIGSKLGTRPFSYHWNSEDAMEILASIEQGNFMPSCNCLSAIRNLRTEQRTNREVGLRMGLESLYEELARTLPDTEPGKEVFSDEHRLQLMGRMFEGEPLRPIETDILALVIEDFPRPVRRFLDGIVDEWLAIFPQSARHYRVDPNTYHISIICPQDVSRHHHSGEHLLKDPSQRLSSEEVRAAFSEIHDTVKGVKSISLRPIGVRAGSNGALIFVFEYEPTIYGLRGSLIDRIKRVTANFTGRPKTMVHITLFRALENVTPDEDMVGRIHGFAAKYEDVTPMLEAEGVPVEFGVDRVHFLHETRWMHAESDLDVILQLGDTNVAAFQAFNGFMQAQLQAPHQKTIDGVATNASPMEQRITTVVGKITPEWGELPTLNQVARGLGVSGSYLRNWCYTEFKQAHPGINFRDYFGLTKTRQIGSVQIAANERRKQISGDVVLEADQKSGSRTTQLTPVIFYYKYLFRKDNLDESWLGLLRSAIYRQVDSEANEVAVVIVDNEYQKELILPRLPDGVECIVWKTIPSEVQDDFNIIFAIYQGQGGVRLTPAILNKHPIVREYLSNV